MIFPRQEYGSELPFPFSGYLPDPEVEPPSPASAGRFFTTEHRRSPCFRLDELVAQSCLTLCNPVDCMQPARLHCPWNSPGKNTGVGCHFLLQRMFLTQGSNQDLLHCRQILYHLSHQRLYLQRFYFQIRPHSLVLSGHEFRMGRTRDLFKKIRDTREHFMQGWV